ncbi:hypothetical protein GZ78_09440 [Endozoicomonas numazuensis]|uniref:Uncharacterized protein n=2 Tax=Endozoicomonas numazuensis TaxID=1137799 RepID=A0A081NHD9_9GAMM|nr:hypothetical protein GZ78_09440 [Endozoicomonas numazuensis]
MAGQVLPYHKGQWLFSVVDEQQQQMDIMLLQGNRTRASDNKLLGNICINQISDVCRGVPSVRLSLSIEESGDLLVSAENLKNGLIRRMRTQIETSDSSIAKTKELVEDIRFKEFAKAGTLARKMIRSNTRTLSRAVRIDKHSANIERQMHSVMSELEQIIQAGSDLQQLQLRMNDLSQLSLQFHFAAYTNPIKAT